LSGVKEVAEFLFEEGVPIAEEAERETYGSGEGGFKAVDGGFVGAAGGGMSAKGGEASHFEEAFFDSSTGGEVSSPSAGSE
jgi:hypothetical protein